MKIISQVETAGCPMTYLVTGSHSDFPLCAVQSPETRQRKLIKTKCLPGNISKPAERMSVSTVPAVWATQLHGLKILIQSCSCLKHDKQRRKNAKTNNFWAGHTKARFWVVAFFFGVLQNSGGESHVSEVLNSVKEIKENSCSTAPAQWAEQSTFTGLILWMQQ